MNRTGTEGTKSRPLCIAILCLSALDCTPEAPKRSHQSPSGPQPRRALPTEPTSDPTTEFSAAEVRAEIRTRQRAIRRCYEEVLAEDPALDGRLEVIFTVAPSGRVVSVSTLEDTVGDPRVAACVVGEIQSMFFDPGPSGGSVTFRYPFVFETRNR